ncbi:Geranylgeranyl transferase type-2 subunit alpha, partial [Globisporangium splendens]
MHGRVKSVEREREQQKTDEQRHEELAKVRMYHEVAGKILALKQQQLYEAHVLPLTSHLLLLNPEFHMVWSYRREIIDAISARAQDKDAELEELAKTELKLTLSYSAWFQRQWIIDRGLGDLQKEIGLCNKLLELDERNFHCWNYRRHVCRLAGVSREDELAFATLKVEQNFSNYSALHHRSISLEDPLAPDVIFDEIGLVQQAVFTEPDDQSAWFYYRWLLSSMLELVESSPEDAISFLRSQVQWMEELVEMETEAKWVIVTLANLHSHLGQIESNATAAENKQKSVELYKRAIAIDPDHCNYYNDMIAKVGV